MKAPNFLVESSVVLSIKKLCPGKRLLSIGNLIFAYLILFFKATPPLLSSRLQTNLFISDWFFCLKSIVRFSGLPVPQSPSPFLWQKMPPLLISISPIISRITFDSSVVETSNLEPGPFEKSEYIR